VRTVLITGARAPIALDLARSFAAAGFTPHLADSIAPWGARLARVAKGRLHRFASPRFAFEAFLRDFATLVERLDPVLIVPTCEEVFYLAEAGRRLGLADRLFAPPPETLRRLHSKVEFAELARACGLPTPETRRIASADELAPWRARAGGLVFKPEFSRFASHARVRPAPEALDALAPSPGAPWAVQDFVDGEEVCIWSAAVKGEITAFAAYRPLWRLGRSSGFYFEADPDPALLETARAVARATSATGQLSFDVIRRPDGQIAPIECNPRGVSGLHLFDADPALARALFGQGGLARPQADARHLALAMWMLGAPQALAEGRLNAFRRDLGRSRDVLSPPGEPWGWAGALLDAGRFALVGLSRGRSAAGQSTDDTEWNGEPIA
jgi:glutathione synthase/RimK-type ligase-like ATP-grasp enzyme